MQISEAGAEEETLLSYQFQELPNPVLEDKKFKELLAKWGLEQTLTINSFRFNQKYEDLDSAQFFKDMFADKSILQGLSSQLGFTEAATEIKATKLKCTQVKLDMFDKCAKTGICVGDSIKMCMPDYQEEIEICNNLRQALLQEESEFWETFDEYEREEFLFHIFSILVLGGSMCQYEDNLSVYLEWTKFFYKNLISARKDSNTENIFVESQVYQIEKIGNQTTSGDHPQNRFYVCINPSVRTINVVTNKWKSFW